MIFTASASAKTILFGEHAVVYGEPAIAIPIPDTRTTAALEPNGEQFRILSPAIGLDASYANLDPESGLAHLLILIKKEFGLVNLPDDTLTISSCIPIASGLGSGAALSTAVVRVFAQRLGFELPPERINRMVYETEKIYHGTPSGIDNTTVVYEQPIFFQKSAGFSPLDADLSGLQFLVIDSGIRSKTVDVVSDVRKNLDRNAGFIHEIGELVLEARIALGRGDPAEIGDLMNRNQELLRKIGVSCPELDDFISLALSMGAPGAKLTGAGRGGNFLVLAGDSLQAEHLKKIFEERGLRVIR